MMRSDRGFTLIELVAAMGIASLVLALSLWLWLEGWRTFHRSLARMERVENEIVARQMLDALIKKDSLDDKRKKITYPLDGTVELLGGNAVVYRIGVGRDTEEEMGLGKLGSGRY